MTFFVPKAERRRRQARGGLTAIGQVEFWARIPRLNDHARVLRRISHYEDRTLALGPENSTALIVAAHEHQAGCTRSINCREQVSVPLVDSYFRQTRLSHMKLNPAIRVGVVNRDVGSVHGGFVRTALSDEQNDRESSHGYPDDGSCSAKGLHQGFVSGFEARETGVNFGVEHVHASIASVSVPWLAAYPSNSNRRNASRFPVLRTAPD